ncbi:RNA editing complex protein MP90 [Trypanosoma rangeli]|uniref:RNA editing complex protein MP90 n=1 Tax=Trypanosoma rangeli TaxID=5698 RepID=A0A422NPH0_TRYRA|nr:RNA editing complex protein MP90 [Trypanosoma rangeli]RNF07397.1 RNA editing complex protein MP90 [Trypanosoma rangeli]|eukprot:RNF07397.1 RNA editing complex protein MP90 [Trypanosoma rangeli]
MPSAAGGSGGGGDSSTTPRLSRHSRLFLQKVQKGAKKESDDRKRHQQFAAAAKQPRSLQCLTTFDCPVCRLRNSVRVDLNTKERQAVVRCTYCMSLRPRPLDLPYPFSTPFVPKLENRADVFFKFNELYRGLAMKAERSGDTHGYYGDTEGSGGYDADGVLAISSSALMRGTTGITVNADATASEGEEVEEEEEAEVEEEEERQQVEGKEGGEDEEDLAGGGKADESVEDVGAFFADSDDD